LEVSVKNIKVNIYKATAAFLVIQAAVFYYYEEMKIPEAVIETIQVVVAASDIPENTIIEKEMLVLEKRYKEDIMKISSAAESYNEVVGKRTMVPLYKGETINSKRLIENRGYMNDKDQTQIALALNEVDKALEVKEGDYIDIWLEPVSHDQDEVIIEPQKIIEKIKIIKVHDSNYNSTTKTMDSINTASNTVFVPAYITIELRDEVMKGIYEVDKGKYNIRVTRYGEEKLYNTVKNIIQEGGD